MKRILLITLLLTIAWSVSAQDSDRFYATMALQDARELQNDQPGEIQILAERGNEAAVYMSHSAALWFQELERLHGPGYIFKRDAESAIEGLNNIPGRNNSRIAFSITEDVAVLEAINLISIQNLEDHIIELENYGTRYHTFASASQAATDLKVKWEDMASMYGRTDVTVRLYNHSSTQMPSVIMTIEGTEFSDEFVIVGGHLDSTSFQGNNNAPGADDNASGIATITEAARALFESGFVPKRTIEFMAYSAEEIGLVGSQEIAEEYGSNNVNVTAYVNFDMTNYNGSGNDVYFITDYTDSSLNTFLMDLMNHYNATGNHAFTYSTSVCNYGCSDHASWYGEGYMAAFPFEAGFGQHNPNIHTANDTFSFMGTAEQAAKFSKLCAEFLIETAKSDGQLGIPEVASEMYEIYVSNNTLYYEFNDYEADISTVVIYDLLGNTILNLEDPDNEGSINMNHLATGMYIVNFTTDYSEVVNKKVIIR